MKCNADIALQKYTLHFKFNTLNLTQKYFCSAKWYELSVLYLCLMVEILGQPLVDDHAQNWSLFCKAAK